MGKGRLDLKRQLFMIEVVMEIRNSYGGVADVKVMGREMMESREGY